MGLPKKLVDEYSGLEIQSENDSEIGVLKDVFHNGEEKIRENNSKYVENQLELNKDFFDTVEDFPLTENQRKTITVEAGGKGQSDKCPQRSQCRCTGGWGGELPRRSLDPYAARDIPPGINSKPGGETGHPRLHEVDSIP